MKQLRRLELNGGRIRGIRPSPKNPLRLEIPPITQGYTNAQIDDYGLARGRRHYPWRPGITLTVQARFSHAAGELLGTAGFGFWNAPFGDPTVRWPALPRAVWFFYGSPPNDLPLAAAGAGQGWYAATLDAGTGPALAMAPLAPFVALLNRYGRFRQQFWPRFQNRLGITFAPVEVDMTAWHEYRLDWRQDGCAFWVDGCLLRRAPHTPRGPLGFVCWIDNQYMIVTARGRVRWGTLSVAVPQWLEIAECAIRQIDGQETSSPNYPSTG